MAANSYPESFPQCTLGWFSNRTGTSVDDGPTQIKQLAWPSLTNGWAANWAPEVESSPFRALFRRQMKFPFCCKISLLTNISTRPPAQPQSGELLVNSYKKGGAGLETVALSQSVGLSCRIHTVTWYKKTTCWMANDAEGQEKQRYYIIQKANTLSFPLRPSSSSRVY